MHSCRIDIQNDYHLIILTQLYANSPVNSQSPGHTECHLAPSTTARRPECWMVLGSVGQKKNYCFALNMFKSESFKVLGLDYLIA